MLRGLSYSLCYLTFSKSQWSGYCHDDTNFVNEKPSFRGLNYHFEHTDLNIHPCNRFFLNPPYARHAVSTKYADTNKLKVPDTKAFPS